MMTVNAGQQRVGASPLSDVSRPPIVPPIRTVIGLQEFLFMGFIRRLFVWWYGATLGTFVTTWVSGHFVGKDAFGNRYYENRGGKRRWVLYKGTVEASRVPPDWHGWLHHT